MNSLVIGDKVARVPIVQGGMGIGISLSGLASAVANEGGIGVISAAGIGMFHRETKDFNEDNVQGMRNEIRIARSKTKGLLGVNIMVALSNFGSLCKAAIEEKIDFIFAGAGLPLKLPEYITKASKTKLVPIISSARAARLIARQWIKKYNYVPDAFVLEGPKAGGHLGFKNEQLEDEAFDLDHLLPEVLAEVQLLEEQYNKRIPVIAGGGIYSGQDVKHVLSLGASGVQMATRFVTTDECDASDAFKQTYIDANEEDIVFIKSPVGLPGRAINNAYLKDVKQGLKQPFACPYDCIITCKKEQAPYCITLALLNAKNGKLHNGFAFAGSNAFKANKISSIHSVFNDILTEYNT